MNSEERAEQERQAWVRSPIRTRLRERRDRQLEVRRESMRAKIGARRNITNDDLTSVKKIGTNGSQMVTVDVLQNCFSMFIKGSGVHLYLGLLNDKRSTHALHRSQ